MIELICIACIRTDIAGGDFNKQKFLRSQTLTHNGAFTGHALRVPNSGNMNNHELEHFMFGLGLPYLHRTRIVVMDVMFSKIRTLSAYFVA